MRLACIGSRTWTDYEFVVDKLKEMCVYVNYHYDTDVISVISGGAKGADSMAEKAARFFGLPVKIYLPEWDKYGKEAALIRNKLIIDDCDEVLCFWDLISSGSMHAMKYAKSKGKPITIYVK